MPKRLNKPTPKRATNRTNARRGSKPKAHSVQLPSSDWRTTVQAYWQTVPDLTASDRLVNKLRLIKSTPDPENKLALLVDVCQSIMMSRAVMLMTLLDAGLTREGHEIDRVAAEILAVL